MAVVTKNPVIRCPENKNGKHIWHKREKRDSRGRMITGFVCKCRAVDYVDLI